MKKHTPQQLNDHAEFLKAIAHPVRLCMLKGLGNGECNVTKMVSQLKLPQSTVSQHLGILRTRGIIAPRKEGTITCYRIIDLRIHKILEALGK